MPRMLLTLKGNIREYYEHFYANKLDSIDEMEKFLEGKNLIKWLKKYKERMKETNKQKEMNSFKVLKTLN